MNTTRASKPSNEMRKKLKDATTLGYILEDSPKPDLMNLFTGWESTNWRSSTTASAADKGIKPLSYG